MANAGLIDLYRMATGNTPQDRTARFVDQELPALANQLYKATTAEEIATGAAALIGAAQKAGYGPKNVELLLDKLVQPARANLGGAELQKIGARFKTDVTQQPSEVPGLRSADLQGLGGLMTPDKLKDIPGKPFDQSDAMDIAGVTSRYGMKTPEGMAGLLTAPSAVNENMGQVNAANALAAERKAQEQLVTSQRTTLDNLPTERGPGGVSARDVGMGSKGTGLASMYNTDADNAAQAPVRQSNVDLNRARGATETARQGELGTRSGANQAREWRTRNQPFSSGGTDADGNPIETVTESERMVDPLKQLDAADAIAEAATSRGATTVEQIAQIADDMGYEIEGTPELDGGGWFGGKPTLKGNFRLRPKGNRRTVVKGKQGAPARPAAASPVARAQPPKAAAPAANDDERRKRLRGMLFGG